MLTTMLAPTKIGPTVSTAQYTRNLAGESPAAMHSPNVIDDGIDAEH